MKISTKIVATIGPASDSVQIIRELYKNGMRVARLNFSHGSHEYFKKVISNIREVSDEIGILLDTKGPEIRSGEIEDGEVELCDEDNLIFTSKKVMGTKQKITINYPKLNELKKGDIILIDDGLIETQVIENKDGDLQVRILNGGRLGSNKTVALRGHSVDIPFLSKKDKEDILFGIEHKVDFIAASFVRTVEDVLLLKKFLKKNESNIFLVSKIEHWQALDNIEGIIQNSDGIMVARGDLGVELPLEKVPKIQKEILKSCNELGKPVIVATQMLESMKNNPVPTRAEISDVAQAILDGADAIMLSGETTVGKYPIKAVSTMQKIAKEYDSQITREINDNKHSFEELSKNSISMFITKSAYLASQILDTGAILAPTESGYTARMVSRFKPKCPIYASTRDMVVFRQLQLSWGVFPILTTVKYKRLAHMITDLINKAYDQKLLKKTDRVVITAGHVLSNTGHTNMVEVLTVSEIIDDCDF